MESIRTMVREYLRYFNITQEAWVSKGRTAHKIYAQRVFANEARIKGYSWQEIAKACGKKSHTTMIKMCTRTGWKEKNIKRYRGLKNDKNKRWISSS